MAYRDTEHLTEIIRDIRERHPGNNRPLAEWIEEEARDPNHPLHDQLKYDDDAGAATLWRVDMCQRFINKTRFAVEHPVTHQIVMVPAFIKDPNQPKGYYRPTIDMREDRELSIDTFIKEINRGKQWVTRMDKLALVVPEMAEFVATLRESLTAMMTRLR